MQKQYSEVDQCYSDYFSQLRGPNQKMGFNSTSNMTIITLLDDNARSCRFSSLDAVLDESLSMFLNSSSEAMCDPPIFCSSYRNSIRQIPPLRPYAKAVRGRKSSRRTTTSKIDSDSNLSVKPSSTSGSQNNRLRHYSSQSKLSPPPSPLCVPSQRRRNRWTNGSPTGTNSNNRLDSTSSRCDETSDYSTPFTYDKALETAPSNSYSTSSALSTCSTNAIDLARHNNSINDVSPILGYDSCPRKPTRQWSSELSDESQE